MRSDTTPGQTSDDPGLDLVMDDNLPEPCVLLADRSYGSDNIRETIETRIVVPVIPMRKHRDPALAPPLVNMTQSSYPNRPTHNPLNIR